MKKNIIIIIIFLGGEINYLNKTKQKRRDKKQNKTKNKKQKTKNKKQKTKNKKQKTKNKPPHLPKNKYNQPPTTTSFVSQNLEGVEQKKASLSPTRETSRFLDSFLSQTVTQLKKKKQKTKTNTIS